MNRIPLKALLRELNKRGDVRFAAFDAKKEIKRILSQIVEASKPLSTGRKIAWNLYVKSPRDYVSKDMYNVDLVYEDVLVDMRKVIDKFREEYRKIYNESILN